MGQKYEDINEKCQNLDMSFVVNLAHVLIITNITERKIKIPIEREERKEVKLILL